MSATPKGTTLRLILPKDSSGKILASLGTSAKVESKDLTLSADRLTTEMIVRNIKEYMRLRDELLHTLRQLGLPREPRVGSPQVQNHQEALAETRKVLDENRSLYQELQSSIEDLQRQIDEAKKQSSRISEILQAGFPSSEVVSATGDFSRILGRIPVRKLADAQRSLASSMKDQLAFATGNRIKDWVYLLVAVPANKTPQVLQTLLLYDFVQTDIPKSDEPDLQRALASLEAKTKDLTKELEDAKSKLKLFQNEAAETLNRLADNIQDSLMQLQAVLKMGEGANVSRTFAWLAKPLSPKTLNALSDQGVLFETG
jgi:uncharacterized protein YlxW (UPF0749 family)